MRRVSWKHGDTHKICSGCGESLPVATHFHQQKYKPKGQRPRKRPLSQCKACHKVRTKRAYRQRRLDQLRLVFDHFRENPCVDCGEDNPALLEFDHVDESAKSFGVGGKIGDVSTPKLLKEIEKCQVRCKNCHHLRTMARQGHFAKIPEAREYLREWKENDEAFDQWEAREQ